MSTKSEHLQIRLTATQKARLKRLARAAGTDMSSYVLDRVLPAQGHRFGELLDLLRDASDPRYPLAELNDLLSELTPTELPQAVAVANLAGLSPHLANYVAAMVEHACHMREVRPPVWTAEVEPLRAPWFAVPLKGLRAHLLRSSPVAFKRRNLFVDSSVGDRV